MTSAGPESRTGYRHVLAIRPFRLLWLGQSTSRLGDGIYVVGLAYLLLSSGQAAAGAATYGALLSCYGFASLVALLPAGAVADLLPRRATLIVTDVVRCFAVLGLAVTAGVDAGPAQYVFAGLLGLGAGQFGPTYAAVIPDVVPRPQLRVAGSLNGMSVQLMRVCGPLVGTGLAVSVGARPALLINAVTFALAAVTTWLARIEQQKQVSRPVLGPRFLMEGIREATRRQWLGGMFVQGAVQAVFVFGLLQVVTPILLGLQGQSPLYGPLLACQAVGSLAAAVLARWLLLRRPGVMVNLCLLLVAAEPLTLLHGNALLLSLAFVAKGFALGTYSVHFFVAVQSKVTPDLRARVSALNQFADSAGRPVANLGAVPALALVGAPVLLVGCAVIAALSAVSVLLVRGVATFGGEVTERSMPAPGASDTVIEPSRTAARAARKSDEGTS